MICADPKELYGYFLQSDFWINLSREKRRRVGKCEECGAKENLQAHHKCYTENLFDVTLSDLTVLCRQCHQKEHHIKVEPPTLPPPWSFITSLKHLDRLRSSRSMDRQTFLKLRAMFPPKHKKVRHHPRRRHKIRRRVFQKVSKFYPYASLHNRPHYVNRGNSSN